MLAVRPLCQHSQSIQVPFTFETLSDDRCAKYLGLSYFWDTVSYTLLL